MTAPAPAPVSPLDRFTAAAWTAVVAAAKARTEDELEAICTGLVLDARAYAAQMIELYARPDDRWGPQ